MDSNRPLQVVTPSVDGDVLTHLALADAWFTPGRLHRAIERHSEDGIRRALRPLVEQGVVEDQRGGNAVLYRLNRSHLASGAIVSPANLWVAFLVRLGGEVQAWSVPPTVVAIFGSAARGTMTAASDIDLLVVRPAGQPAVEAWTAQVHQLSARAGSWTGNDVRVLELTEEHVRDRAGTEPVLADVAAQGVTVYGDPDWLRRLVTLARLTSVSS